MSKKYDIPFPIKQVFLKSIKIEALLISSTAIKTIINEYLSRQNMFSSIKFDFKTGLSGFIYLYTILNTKIRKSIL